MTRNSLALLSISLGLCASGAVFAGTSGQQLAEGAGHSLIGRAAPPLVLKTIDGQSIDLAQLYGRQAVYLKFWATWCVPCRQQMPHFERTYERAGHDLAVIAVNVGFNDTVEDVKAYRESLGLHMPIVIDDGRVAEALHLRVTPQHVVVGRDGKILYIGHLVDERLESALKVAREQRPVPFSPGVTTSARPSELLVGAQVPATSLKTFDGSGISLSDPAGSRATVVMFISPWCESYLKQSRPERAAACERARVLSERMAAGASKMRWVAIASGLWATADDLAAYRLDKHVTIPLALDETGSVFRQFGVRDVPAFVVVDATGRIVGRTDGAHERLDEQLSRVAADTH